MKSFIVEKDLYVRPLAVIGVGVGAAVGLALAGRYPSLVGALGCIEFTPWTDPQLAAFFIGQVCRVAIQLKVILAFFAATTTVETGGKIEMPKSILGF